MVFAVPRPALLVRLADQPLECCGRLVAAVSAVSLGVVIGAGVVVVVAGSGWPQGSLLAPGSADSRHLTTATLIRWLTPGWTPFEAMHLRVRNAMAPSAIWRETHLAR